MLRLIFTLYGLYIDLKMSTLTVCLTCARIFLDDSLNLYIYYNPVEQNERSEVAFDGQNVF